MIILENYLCVQCAFSTWKSNISPPPWQKFFRFVEESLIHLIRILLHRHRVGRGQKDISTLRSNAIKQFQHHGLQLGSFFLLRPHVPIAASGQLLSIQYIQKRSSSRDLASERFSSCHSLIQTLFDSLRKGNS